MKWHRFSCETRSHVKSIPDLKRTVRFIHIYTVRPPCHETWSQNPLVSAHHASFHLRLAFYISECRHLFQLSIREPSYGRTGTWSCTCFLLFTFWPIREYVSQCSWIAFPKAKCKQIQLAFQFSTVFPIHLFPLLFVPLANAPNSVATTPFLQRGVGSFYSLTWFEPPFNRTGPGPIAKPQN